METATTRLLDALRASQGGITDYRAGKLLQVSTSTVSKWRVGKGHMSTANVQRACELAGLDVWEWNLRIAAEREQGPDGDIYREAVADLERVQRGEDPSPSGLFALLTRGTRAAAILAALLFASPHTNTGVSGVAHASELEGDAPSLYILLNGILRAFRRLQSQVLRLIRRRRALELGYGRRMRRIRAFCTVFPVFVLAGCTALQTPEELAWQSLHVVDALQTRDAARDPCYREGYALTRELIGERPSSADVAVWTVGMSALHAGVTELLLQHEHPRLAKLWSYVTLGEKAYAVGHNYSIGIRIGGANKTPRGCTR